MTGVPGTSDFPTALDSHTTLVQVKDGASTTVGSGGVNSSVTTIIATDTSTFSSSGIITVEGEHITYTSTDSTHFLGCARGQFTSLGGSAAAAHSAGAVIKQLVIAATHEVQNSAIVATQTKLGSGASTPASAKYLRGNGAGTSAWDDIHSADIATALGFTPVDGITVQVGDADQGTNITTLDLDNAYFAAGSESPSGEYNLTLKAPPIQNLGTVVLASDVATLPALNAMTTVAVVTVDTEASAATDNLATITPTGAAPDGTILILTTLSASRDVTVKNGAGNIVLTDGDFVMGTTGYRLMLVRTGSSWVELARQPVTQLGNALYQPLDADLTAIAGLTSAANKLPYFTGSGAAALADLSAAGRALIDDADAAAQRATLGLVIGTNVQALNANLTTLAGLTGAADKVPYFTGVGAMTHTTLSAFARTLIDDADAATARATIGVQPGSITFLANYSGAVWTNMPSAETFFGGSALLHTYVDFSKATEFRLNVYQLVAGATGSVLRVKYDNGTSWVDLAATAGAGDATAEVPGTTKTPWVSIATAARVDNIRIAVHGAGGNGTADPSWNMIRLEYR